MSRVLFVVLNLVVASVAAQQLDPSFDASVPQPAYLQDHPKVLFDEAHRNHRAYGPFVELIRNDGYEITPNTEAFSRATLDQYDVLVIVNPNFKGAPDNLQWPAFAEAECDAVFQWVFDGGALLLITDYGSTAVAAEQLSQRFGIEIRKSRGTQDPVMSLARLNPGWLVFSRENNLLRDHPITRGRTTDETINRVVTFYGVSLKGPEGATAFLSLSPGAVDLYGSRRDQISAAGRAQGIAESFGRGRVVVLGEARMLTATLPDGRPVGWNQPGNDDRQLALNIMHWLSGLM
jgi:hypothetical protein